MREVSRAATRDLVVNSLTLDFSTPKNERTGNVYENKWADNRSKSRGVQESRSRMREVSRAATRDLVVNSLTLDFSTSRLRRMNE